MLGRLVGSTIGLSTKTAASLGQRAELARIRNVNARRRGVEEAGIVDPSSLFAPNARSIISGGNEGSRQLLAVAAIASATHSGLPVVLVHEGNQRLVDALTASLGRSAIIEIGPGNPLYEPVYGLLPNEMSRLVSEAMGGHGGEPGVYLEALGTILERKGVGQYVRMLDSCPHGRVNEIVDALERSSSVSPKEALCLRRDADISTESLGALRGFLRDVAIQGGILAWREHLTDSLSIARHAMGGSGVLCLDVESMTNNALIALLAADAALAIRRHGGFHLAVDFSSAPMPEPLLRILYAGIGFTVCVEDVCTLGGGKDGARDIVMHADKCAILRHGGISAEVLSDMLGEYDKVDASIQQSNGGSFGIFGYNHTATRGVTTMDKRERVVKPEELASLDAAFGEMFLLDRASKVVLHGSLRGMGRKRVAGLFR